MSVPGFSDAYRGDGRATFTAKFRFFWHLIITFVLASALILSKTISALPKTKENYTLRGKVLITRHHSLRGKGRLNTKFNSLIPSILSSRGSYARIKLVSRVVLGTEFCLL
jgi:hypothetical protein